MPGSKNTLKIGYREQGQAAVLSVDEPTTGWYAVRQACEDRVDEVWNESGTSLSLPWWAFLSCREGVQFALATHDMEVEFDTQAEALLVTSRHREDRYVEAARAPPLKAEEVSRILKARGFSRRLTEHQVRNVSRLAALSAGASFSVPGAGKTTEALAYYFLRAEPGTRLLVIAPLNAFAAWEEQLALCVPDAGFQFTRLVGGSSSVAKLLDEAPLAMLVTYQQLLYVRDTLAGYITRYPAFVFVDESHRMKRGMDGKQGAAVLGLSHLPAGKLVLSGTPLPNSLEDLVPQFDFLYPEIRSTANTIGELIRPVYVRTTKAELGLKPPLRRRVEVPLRPGQRHLYELLRSEAAREAEGALTAEDRIRLRSVGRSAMRLLQLVSNPSLLAAQNIGHPDLTRDVLAEGDGPKVEYVTRRARQLAQRGQKCVIWSGFVANVELIAARLNDIGADYIHGGVEAGSEEDAEKREAKIRRFHDEKEAYVLVANPAAASEGISLHTVCHHAIYLDRNYNAAQYLQSEDRIHRLGLPKHVETHVEIVVAPGTIDESVHRRLVAKVEEMRRVLDDPSLNIEPVSVDPEDPSLDSRDIEDIVKHLLGASS